MSLFKNNKNAGVTLLDLPSQSFSTRESDSSSQSMEAQSAVQPQVTSYSEKDLEQAYKKGLEQGIQQEQERSARAQQLDKEQKEHQLEQALANYEALATQTEQLLEELNCKNNELKETYVQEAKNLIAIALGKILQKELANEQSMIAIVEGYIQQFAQDKKVVLRMGSQFYQAFQHHSKTNNNHYQLELDHQLEPLVYDLKIGHEFKRIDLRKSLQELYSFFDNQNSSS